MNLPILNALKSMLSAFRPLGPNSAGKSTRTVKAIERRVWRSVTDTWTLPYLRTRSECIGRHETGSPAL